MFRLLLILSLFFTACTEKQLVLREIRNVPQELSIQTISKIAIPVRENGYRNFSTQVIKTKNDFDYFLLQVKNQKGWKQKENFLQTLRLKEIDFNRYNLLLYRITEPSSSTVLAVDVPRGNKQHIIIKIGRDEPQMRTSDVAYYTLAYKIKKDVQSITFDNGIKKDVISLQ
jgi:hypothetical protein